MEVVFLFFHLFSSGKEEYIEEYADKMAAAAVNDTLDADSLEDFIAYAKEKDLGNKQLARAQAMACDKAFEKLYHDGYMDDDEYGMFSDLLKICYMMKEEAKYKYTTIAKRCNALYKIQEEGLMPTVSREYANVRYRDGEKLHFTSAARLMKPKKPLKKGGDRTISKGHPFRVGNWENKEDKNLWEAGDKGAFWITSERMGFRSRKEQTVTELSDLDHVELGNGPLCVYEKGKDSPWCAAIDDYEMAGALLSRILNGKDACSQE